MNSVKQYNAFVLFTVIFITSCHFKNPIKSSILKKKEETKLSFLSRYTLDIKTNEQKNILFVALDEEIQPSIRPKINAYFKSDKDIFLEDIVFHGLSKYYKGLYTKVYNLDRSQINEQTFNESIKYMENLKEPYDVFLLVHGLPNRLLGNKTGEPNKRETCIGMKCKEITYDDIEKLPKLHYLNLIYLQSCYGSTLVERFISRGAKAVISFKDRHENYFYLNSFLKNYNYLHGDIKNSFEFTNNSYRNDIQKNSIINAVLKFMGIKDIEAYTDSLEDPNLKSS